LIVVLSALSVRPGSFDGAATFCLNLARELPTALPEALVIVLVREGETRLDHAAGLSIRPVSLPTALHRIGYEAVLLPRLLKHVGADVLISPNESVPVRLSCPMLVVAQNLVYHRPSGTGTFVGDSAFRRLRSRVQASYYKARMRSAYRRAAKIVAVSAETARVLESSSGLDLAKTSVVHEGADSFLLPPARAEGRLPRLLVVSALSPYKGLEQTLALFAKLRVGRPDLTLELVGADWRGFRGVLERLARDLDVHASVRFRGPVQPQELADLYATSSVLLALSSVEAFGLPLVEAMRYGLPVVAADRSSLPEVAGGGALLVDPDDVPAAEELVAALLADPMRWSAQSAAGFRRAEDLTWAKTAAGIAEATRSAVRS
jgi:glycosyltransferase involved in cell wall biosynthesis